MTIYEKSVRILLKDFVSNQKIVKGQIIPKHEVISWFRENYPKIKTGTITAHLVMMSVNAPSRIHYNLHTNGEDDLFYQIDGSHIRLYEAGNDPPPVYSDSYRGREAIGQIDNSETTVEDAPDPIGTASERPLRDLQSNKSWSSQIDIEQNLHDFIFGDNKTHGIRPLERYASFDYCFNYFQSFREQNRLDELVNPKHIQESCLHLGFYLASWGMLRGSTFLQGKSVKVYETLINAIATANSALWDVDVNCYTPINIRLILDFSNTIAQALPYDNGPSDTLVTKIMLGVFGNVPAFDSYFKKGFGVTTFGRQALEKIARFYETHSSVIDQNRRPTLDFLTEQPTSRYYTRAKVVDMIFFIEGGK